MRANNSTNVTEALLDSIGEAFNSNNIEEVMQYFAKDTVFDHAAGPDIHGKRFEGRSVVRDVFASLFDSVEKVHWETLCTCINGNKAYCEYRRTATLKSGEQQDFLSVDVLTFKDGLIVHKDTYYKNRG